MGTPMAIEDHADVDLASDVGRLLDEHRRHFLPLLAGLLGDEPESLKRPLPRPPAWI
jgi:hypothetical protein